MFCTRYKEESSSVSDGGGVVSQCTGGAQREEREAGRTRVTKALGTQLNMR